jgi:cell division protein FtsI (penicillin-binding protein 3)
VSFANIAFGQGVTATPLQIANATAVIANGGMLLEPHVVKRVVDKDGLVIRETTPTLIRRVLTPEVAQQTAWAMSLVPRKGGTGLKAAMEHYTVAGKTGTAQKVNPETRRYDNLWLGSFVGFAPAENPAVVVAVMIDEPKGRGFGGVVAAPAFHKIATEALSVMGIVPIPPEERFQFDEEKHPAAKFAPANNPAKKADAAPAPADPPAEEALADLAPPANSDATGLVPDLRGLTLREAVGRVRELGGLPEVEGWGRVVSQEPPPGTPLSETKRITVALSPATRQSLMAEEPSLGGTE